MPASPLETLVGYTLITIAMIYIAFPRQTTNIFIAVFYRKSYVDVWLKQANTEFVEKWLVVPPPDKQTKIKGKYYTLSEQYALNKTDDGRINGMRPLFMVDENDAIPRQFDKGSPDEKIFKVTLSRFSRPVVAFKPYSVEDIIFQSEEFGRALQNRIDKKLFADKPDKIQNILLIVIGIVAILALYEATIIQKNTVYLDYIVQHINTTIPGK